MKTLRVWPLPAAAPNSLCHRRRLLRRGRRASLGILALAGVLAVRGEGFRNPPPGAFSLGRAGGRIAQIDDSSAVTHNPANLMDLAEVEVQLTPTLANLNWEFSSATAPGQAASTEEPWKYLPAIFAAVPLKNRDIAFGLGITTPYGIGGEWDADSSAFAPFTGILRYQSAHSTDLKAFNFNPSAALRLGEHAQIGAGLDCLWSELTLKQYYPWFLVTGSFADPDGNAKVKGDGVGFGGNVGITVSVAERHRFAVTYRSAITINYEGDFDLDNVPAAFGGQDLHSGFGSEVQFPTIVAVGYGFQVCDTVRLEVDAEWIQFSNFDQLPLEIQSPPPGLPASAPQDWEDTFTIGIGGDWRFASNWVLRASYQYYESPVPDSTLSPTVMDANQNVVTVGLAFHSGHHGLELAYSPVFYDTRHIRNSYNPAFNGDYEITLHLISLAYRFRF